MQGLDVIGRYTAFAADFVDESSDKLCHRCSDFVHLLILKAALCIIAIAFSNTWENKPQNQSQSLKQW